MEIGLGTILASHSICMGGFGNPRVRWIYTYSGLPLAQVDITYICESLQASLFFYNINPNSGPLQRRPAESRLLMISGQAQLVVAGQVSREVSHRCRQVQDQGLLKGMIFVSFWKLNEYVCACRFMQYSLTHGNTQYLPPEAILIISRGANLTSQSAWANFGTQTHSPIEA
jgi:hypothetical protein